jgi:hypothetical protein
MDTPLHALAMPDADRTTLKDPAIAADELLEVVRAGLARPARVILSGAKEP